ncbi:MAG: hypothetical protein WCG04_00300 [Alphaproteobacteria bacterium]
MQQHHSRHLTSVLLLPWPQEWPRNDGSGVITSSPPSLRGVYTHAIQALS